MFNQETKYFLASLRIKSAKRFRIVERVIQKSVVVLNMRDVDLLPCLARTSCFLTPRPTR
jgi:hypothetical protein